MDPLLAPARPTFVTAPLTFSQHAEQKMWELLKDSDNQVGSKYPGDRKGKQVTDCITYVRLVLEHAFDKAGHAAAVAGVRANYQKGTNLAQYLVRQGWNGYYWNPDVRVPRDGNSEHPVSYRMVVASRAYYNIPVTGLIINYNLTSMFSSGRPAPRRVADMDAFNKFSKVRFAYGLARGGMHTFLISFGMVYEVHWDAIGGVPNSKLYERSALYSYGWLSGLVVTPPDAGFTLP